MLRARVVWRALAAALTLAVGVPATAEAGTFSTPSAGTLRYDAAPGDADLFADVYHDTVNSQLVFRRAPAGEQAFSSDTPECSGGTTTMACDDSITLLVMALGDEGDALTVLSLPDAASLAVEAGAGSDVVVGSPASDALDGGAGSDLLDGAGGGDAIRGGDGVDQALYDRRSAGEPVSVTLDEAANDGRAGEGDNVDGDVEVIRGGAGPDVLIGNANSNALIGGDGDDQLVGGAGPDILLGDAGGDTIEARDGTADSVDCGDGANDAAAADAIDALVACETATASPDGDGDGVPRIADCDDTNPSIHPAARERPGNATDEDCSGRADPFPLIASRIASAWKPIRAVTRVRRLALLRVPAGATVTLRCQGRGCASPRRRSVAVPRGARRLDLARFLRRARLRPGARIEVRVTAVESIGLLVRFRTRRGRAPSMTTLCLPPDRKRPLPC